MRRKKRGAEAPQSEATEALFHLDRVQPLRKELSARAGRISAEIVKFQAENARDSERFRLKGVEECWMDFDGARMRYLRAGSGPPLILLHGCWAYSFSWRFTLPALAPYATVYAPDLLGAGFSDRPRGIDHSMRGTALRVLKFAESLGLSSFDLLGTSRGGAVAMCAAAECSSRRSKACGCGG